MLPLALTLPTPQPPLIFFHLPYLGQTRNNVEAYHPRTDVSTRFAISTYTPGMGGTYRFARLPVRGPLATGWYRQKSTVGGRFRSSAVDFGRRRSISAVGGRFRPSAVD
ncbi:hypothetical protein GW17_00042256 [Ensete ventricosum]|nr:hypothetical protein GW17_00042256 [Ensete ventricosum]